MTSKIIVNTIEADTGISSVTFASNINLQNDSSVLVSSSGIRLGTGSTISAPSANELALSTNSAERFRITSGGLVGIGTDNPDNYNPNADDLVIFGTGHQGLTIRSGTSHDGSIMFNDTDNANQRGIIRYLHTDDSMAFHTSGGEVLRITSGGNVGINTTTFAANGTNFKVSDGTISRLALDKTGANARKFEIGNFGTGLNVYDVTADEERLRITSGGLVGVNCTPLSQFQVKSGTNQNIALSSMSSEASIEAFNDAGSANVPLRLRGQDFKFYTSSTEKFRIDSTGQVTLYDSPGIQLSAKSSSLYSLDGSLSYYGTNNGVYLNGAGTNGWLRLNASGAENNHNAINIFGGGAGAYIQFVTSQTERLRISTSTITCATGVGMAIDGGTSSQATDSSLLVTKQNNNDWALQVRNYEGTSTDYAFYSRTKSTASYAIGVYDADNSSWRFRVNGVGSIHATNTTVQSISDQRLKENIVDANSQWDDIKALRFRNFRWREDSGYSDGKTYLGLIAQEVEPISPNLIEINAQSKEDIENEVPDPEYKNVKYSIVWMKAVKALQEAQTRIETLETQLTDALARITALEG